MIAHELLTQVNDNKCIFIIKSQLGRKFNGNIYLTYLYKQNHQNKETAIEKLWQ